MKLYYQNCGLNWAIGIEGEPTEIKQQFDSFFNYGAIDETAELHEMSKAFAYIWTTEKRLKKYFVNSSLFRMLNNADELQQHDPEGWAHCCKGIKGGFMPQARINAQKRFDNMEQETWLRFGRSNEAYSMGTVSAENLDSDA